MRRSRTTRRRRSRRNRPRKMRWSPLPRPRRASPRRVAGGSTRSTRRDASRKSRWESSRSTPWCSCFLQSGARLRGSTFPSFPLRDSGSPFPIFGHTVSHLRWGSTEKIAKANAHTRRRRRVANSPNPDPQRVNGISIPRRRFETHGPLVSQPPRKLYSGSFAAPTSVPRARLRHQHARRAEAHDELFGCPHCPTRATAARSQLVSSQASRRARRSHLRSPLARARGEGRSFARRLWRSSGRPRAGGRHAG